MRGGNESGVDQQDVERRVGMVHVDWRSSSTP
jgi:hypothetical protein